MDHAEKPSHAYKIQAGDGFIIMERYREFKSFAAHLPIPTRGDRSPTDKMRITVSCPNIKTYLDLKFRTPLDPCFYNFQIA